MDPTKKLTALIVAAALNFYYAARLRADDNTDALLYGAAVSTVETQSVETIDTVSEAASGYSTGSAPADFFTSAPEAEKETGKFYNTLFVAPASSAPAVVTSGLDALVLDGEP